MEAVRLALESACDEYSATHLHWLQCTTSVFALQQSYLSKILNSGTFACKGIGQGDKSEGDTFLMNFD